MLSEGAFVDCDGVQRYAGSAIDGFLAKELEEEFRDHLERCRSCRNEIALEKLSKHLVHRYVSWIPTPRSIQTFVVASLEQEYRITRSVDGSWGGSLPRFRILVPALAGGAVAAAFFLMVGLPSDRLSRQSVHIANNDLIHQSLESFAQVTSGRFVPAIVSSAPESVSGFFQRSSLPFGVQIPSLGACDWYGGSASVNEGVQQAHLVYKFGEEWVYVCETNGKDAMTGSQLTLPPAAKVALTRSGWYTDPMHPTCNIVLWKKDEVVCVAVSTMGKERLRILLTVPTNLSQQF